MEHSYFDILEENLSQFDQRIQKLEKYNSDYSFSNRNEWN